MHSYEKNLSSASSENETRSVPHKYMLCRDNALAIMAFFAKNHERLHMAPELMRHTYLALQSKSGGSLIPRKLCPLWCITWTSGSYQPGLAVW